jgi:hypothetical protein
MVQVALQMALLQMALLQMALLQVVFRSNPVGVPSQTRAMTSVHSCLLSRRTVSAVCAHSTRQ